MSAVAFSSSGFSSVRLWYVLRRAYTLVMNHFEHGTAFITVLSLPDLSSESSDTSCEESPPQDPAVSGRGALHDCIQASPLRTDFMQTMVATFLFGTNPRLFQDTHVHAFPGCSLGGL